MILKPNLRQIVNELLQANDVAGNGVIVHPTLHNTTYPASRLAEVIMPTFAKRLLDLGKRGAQVAGLAAPCARERWRGVARYCGADKVAEDSNDAIGIKECGLKKRLKVPKSQSEHAWR